MARGGNRGLRQPARGGGQLPGKWEGCPPEAEGGCPPETEGSGCPEEEGNGSRARPGAARSAGAERQKAGTGVLVNVWRLKFTMYAFQAAHAAGVRSPLAQALATRAPAESKPGQGVPKCLK